MPMPADPKNDPKGRQETGFHGAPLFPRVSSLFSLCYLLLEKSSKCLIPLRDCPFVLKSPPCFLGESPCFPEKTPKGNSRPPVSPPPIRFLTGCPSPTKAPGANGRAAPR